MIQLKKGDRIAIVSLSSGILGEPFCAHQVELGKKRLEEFGLEVVFMPHALKGLDYVKAHPEKRAEDLLAAFADNSIQGIQCAIGGEDTFRIAPYLLNDEAKSVIQRHPKFFMGYSDSTVDHLMLLKLGLPTYYGLSFLTCFAELGESMLPYSRQSFANIFTDKPFDFAPSPVWYEERSDFSASRIGVPRVSHSDSKGFELLQGDPQFAGHLVGGCIESIYDLLAGERYPEEAQINRTYQIFPEKAYFERAILFLETSEDQPTPEKYGHMLRTLAAHIDFGKLHGIFIGKPQNEVHYEAYKQVLKALVPAHVPILYNLHFGHAYPKMLLQYGAQAQADAIAQRIRVERL